MSDNPSGNRGYGRSAEECLRALLLLFGDIAIDSGMPPPNHRRFLGARSRYTETAVCVAYAHRNPDAEDHRLFNEALFRRSTNTFYLAGEGTEGRPRRHWSREGANECSRAGFLPLSEANVAVASNPENSRPPMMSFLVNPRSRPKICNLA